MTPEGGKEYKKYTSILECSFKCVFLLLLIDIYYPISQYTKIIKVFKIDLIT